MKRIRTALLLTVFSLFSGFVPGILWSQDSQQNVPGLFTTIPPNVEYDEVVNRADVVELLASLPEPDAELKEELIFQKEQWAQDIRYSRPVWCLQFEFKPLRVVDVDLPNKEGTMDTKKVLYLLYRVTNPRLGPEDKVRASIGEELAQPVPFPVKSEIDSKPWQPEVDMDQNLIEQIPAEVKKPLPKIELDGALTLRNEPGLFEPKVNVGLTAVFVPQFIISSEHVVTKSTETTDPETGVITSTIEEKSVVYVDQSIPKALPAIMAREGFTQMPETTVSAAGKKLEVGESLWGVAMWTDVDPRISKFSITVSGLTNAYRWKDGVTAQYKPGDPLGTGRAMERRVLKLNWWRVGDPGILTDKEIKYGWPGALDYEWVYR